MKPQLGKLVLTGHITFSTGWLGAVAVFLALAITGLTTADNQVALSSYIAMEICTLYIIVPFCLASLFTGLIQALGTKWGLFRYYWVSVKLFLTVVMTILLFLHLQPVGYLAGAATDGSLLNTRESELAIDLIAKAGAAALALVAITAISIYKPWGRIQGRLLAERRSRNRFIRKGSAGLYLLLLLVVLILVFIIMHLFGDGMKLH